DRENDERECGEVEHGWRVFFKQLTNIRLIYTFSIQQCNKKKNFFAIYFDEMPSSRARFQRGHADGVIGCLVFTCVTMTQPAMPVPAILA
ncbi:MAG: hypothetical protein IKR62_04820, partial [Victivallales bacterium]|nr:hypothetical protein [Victivallales bacterium]